MNGVICIFAKVPRAGHVKTRLAKSLGDASAVALAEAFIEDTVALATTIPSASVVIAFDDAAPACWQSKGIATTLQGDGDLGARLERVLGRALADHPWAIALGADSPGMPATLVCSAVDALVGCASPAAALGPCRDGGFYLLGVSALAPGTLARVRWSTSSAHADTERALTDVGVPITRLDPWFDVDEIEDLDHLRDLLRQRQVTAPATARALEAIDGRTLDG